MSGELDVGYLLGGASMLVGLVFGGVLSPVYLLVATVLLAGVVVRWPPDQNV